MYACDDLRGLKLSNGQPVHQSLRKTWSHWLCAVYLVFVCCLTHWLDSRQRCICSCSQLAFRVLLVSGSLK